MPKPSQMSSWVVIAGVALIAQGCWEDEQDRFALLGEGGCRTSGNIDGNHVVISGVSFEQCQARCLDENGHCTAVEYNTNNNACEIHSDTITTFEKVQGVSCLKRR